MGHWEPTDQSEHTVLGGSFWVYPWDAVQKCVLGEHVKVIWIYFDSFCRCYWALPRPDKPIVLKDNGRAFGSSKTLNREKMRLYQELYCKTFLKGSVDTIGCNYSLLLWTLTLQFSTQFSDMGHNRIGCMWKDEKLNLKAHGHCSSSHPFFLKHVAAEWLTLLPHS